VALLTRRQGLTAVAVVGAVGVLTACTSQNAAPDASSGAAAAASATAGLADEVAAQEHDLVAVYDAVIAGFPSLAAALGTIRDQHVQHAAALGSPATAAATPGAAPGSQGAALGMLIGAERDALHARIASCVAAPDAALARTLAFIAASEGSHVPALRDLRA
jgi:hypothetical protein